MNRPIILTLLITSLGYAQAPVESFATELISLVKDMKDVQKDGGRLAPIAIRYLNESPKWDKARLDREFGALWAAAKNENYSPLQQGTFYKTATSMFHQPKYGEQLAREHMSEVVAAIVSGDQWRQLAILDHTSRLTLPGLPDELVTLMAKTSLVIDSYPGSLLLQLAAGSNAASPAILEAIRAVLKKPPGMQYKLYGGYLDGAASQASNPTVRAMIQEIAERSGNESIERIARGVLAK
jgi:hypothetical protein